ncbi:HD domain-containing protein [Fructobacillus sp. M2-14]|uniref:HD domain-containing protein n=1 Tax=Fructobacillus broussonetiae TaxID=2713173 RepID=A0ABS5R2H5_9LACO|nr:HD domain-containing protein [Fructobacillus broussonetiae]MBS9339155.1 HD domain-containing protein [Fructobacillus broussonetiae]
MNIAKIETFSKKTLDGDASGHDWFHAKRVADWAVRFYEEDHGEADGQTENVLRAGGYLHDTIDDKVVVDVLSQIDTVEKLLSDADFSKEQIDDVMDTIQHLSYSANLEEKHELSTLGKYVQDADRIEALGAIGIARVFAYGGAKGRAIADPRSLPKTSFKNKLAYRNSSNPSVNHFYEKLFKLPAQLNTAAGRKEGAKRADYMKYFLRTFNEETGLLENKAFDLDKV